MGTRAAVLPHAPAMGMVRMRLMPALRRRTAATTPRTAL